MIDIGSNTTRLLVAGRRGGGYRQLLSHRSYNRLGRALLADGSIRDEQIDRLAETLQVQSELARVLRASKPITMATAAVREATNREQLRREIEHKTNLAIEVLSEEEEARLAFLGATHPLPKDEPGTIAVVDVGGGSTEVAVGTVAEGVKWSTSFRIGSGQLTERHIDGDPPSAGELASTRQAITQMFEEFPFPAVDQAIAIGGTASSLRKLVGNVLEHETLERALRLITSNDAEQIAERFALDLERVQVLPAGMLVLEAIGDHLQLPLKIGKGGVREGKLLELLV